MQTQRLIDVIPAHAPVWVHIQRVLEQNRLPHALLFTGSRHLNILQFTQRLIAILNCQNNSDVSSKPCYQCLACRLLLQDTHPDICYIRPENTSFAIKIEQVRELQQDVYQMPRIGSHRFIVMEPADKLNRAAANALLKILEEPPAHTRFILIAEQISTLPITIMSRCQQYHFPDEHLSFNYLSIGKFYSETTERSKLFQQSESIIAALNALIEKKTNACALAATWSTYPLDDFLWFLYLITAQAIQSRLKMTKEHLFVSLSLVTLFAQIDKINVFLRKIQQNITLNQTLTLESILLGYA